MKPQQLSPSCLARSDSASSRERLSVLMAAETLTSIIDSATTGADARNVSTSLDASSTCGESHDSPSISENEKPVETSHGMIDTSAVPPKNMHVQREYKKRSFPEQLMDVLSNEECSAIISWLPDGRAFKIHKPYLFESLVLSRYFTSSHYASFIRKLNRWGFRRLTNGDHSNAFSYPSFLRDDPNKECRLRAMKCQSLGPISPERRKRELKRKSTRKSQQQGHQEQSGLSPLVSSLAAGSIVGNPTLSSVLDILKPGHKLYPNLYGASKVPQCRGLYRQPLFSGSLSNTTPTIPTFDRLMPLQSDGISQSNVAPFSSPLLTASQSKVAKSRAALQAAGGLCAPGASLNFSRSPSKMSAGTLGSILSCASSICSSNGEMCSSNKGSYLDKDLQSGFGCMASRHQTLLQKTQQSRAMLQKSGLLV